MRPTKGQAEVQHGCILCRSLLAPQRLPACPPLLNPATPLPLPPPVATVAMIMINLLPRRDLMDEGREEGEEVRPRAAAGQGFPDASQYCLNNDHPAACPSACACPLALQPRSLPLAPSIPCRSVPRAALALHLLPHSTGGGGRQRGCACVGVAAKRSGVGGRGECLGGGVMRTRRVVMTAVLWPLCCVLWQEVAQTWAVDACACSSAGGADWCC